MVDRNPTFEGFPLSEDTATEMLAWHLMMACKLFANVPEDQPAVLEELSRIMREGEFCEQEIAAAADFTQALWEMYKEMSHHG